MTTTHTFRGNPFDDEHYDNPYTQIDDLKAEVLRLCAAAKEQKDQLFVYKVELSEWNKDPQIKWVSAPNRKAAIKVAVAVWKYDVVRVSYMPRLSYESNASECALVYRPFA